MYACVHRFFVRVAASESFVSLSFAFASRLRRVLGSPLRTCVEAVSFSISNHSLPVSPTSTDPNLTTGTHFTSLKTARFASLRAHRALALGRSPASRAPRFRAFAASASLSASSRIVNATETPSAVVVDDDGDDDIPRAASFSSSYVARRRRSSSCETVGVVDAIASHIASIILLTINQFVCSSFPYASSVRVCVCVSRTKNPFTGRATDARARRRVTRGTKSFPMNENELLKR